MVYEQPLTSSFAGQGMVDSGSKRRMFGIRRDDATPQADCKLVAREVDGATETYEGSGTREV